MHRLSERNPTHQEQRDETHTPSTVKPWKIGEREGRQCLLTPEGKPFLMLGMSHVGGALCPWPPRRRTPPTAGPSYWLELRLSPAAKANR